MDEIFTDGSASSAAASAITSSTAVLTDYWPVWNTWTAENRVLASTAAVAPITPGFGFAVVPSSGEAASSSSRTFFFAASSNSYPSHILLPGFWKKK